MKTETLKRSKFNHKQTKNGGAVRFDCRGGSEFGVECREHKCVLQWEAKADGRLRVSVWGGKRGGGAAGGGVHGCCVINLEMSHSTNKNIANHYYVHTNILKYDIFM